MNYSEFIKSKTGLTEYHGFDISENKINSMLFDWQKHLVQWALKKGRSAIFADCGLGKTPIQLDWSNQIIKRTNKRILVLTPLAVSQQTISEGEKFGIKCKQSRDGKFNGEKLIITNYEKLHYFDWKDFIGVVCDESGVLKHFTGVRQKAVTEFMKRIPYRLLCTATPSPNDYIEMGTSSEAIGELGYMDMLNRFFKNTNNTSDTGRMHGKVQQWRFKKHAEKHFWQWVSSWARALRLPSDLGNYKNDDFELPPIKQRQFEIKNTRPHPGKLFPEEAIGLREERIELRMTLKERCEKVAEIVNQSERPFVVWCQLNDEGDLLEKLIPDAVQVAGKHSDDKKEERLISFQKGQQRGLITKSKIAGFGLNWQHCSHMTFFPSHSFEQWYQSVRRCWRFGQKETVKIDVVTTPGMQRVLKNLQRKADAADKMFSQIVKYMNNSKSIKSKYKNDSDMEVPSWL